MRFTAPHWRPSAARRRAPLRMAIDVTALAGIMIGLLFLLMPLYPTHPRSIPADLPATSNASLKPGARRDDAVIFAILRDGSVYIGNTRVLLQDLSEQLHGAVGDPAHNVIYVKADARAKYGDVKAVLDKIHLAGFENVTFLTTEISH